MDKRFKALEPQEQILRKHKMIETVLNHPEWDIGTISEFIRGEMRFTQREMARITKVSYRTIQVIEDQKAQANPTYQTVVKLLKPFGLALGVIAPKNR